MIESDQSCHKIANNLSQETYLGLRPRSGLISKFSFYIVRIINLQSLVH